MCVCDVCDECVCLSVTIFSAILVIFMIQKQYHKLPNTIVDIIRVKFCENALARSYNIVYLL